MKFATKSPNILLLFAIPAFLILTSCSSGKPSTTELTPVTFQMGWIYDYSSAGIIAMQENGHLAENGLEATVNIGGFNDQGYIDPISKVVDGEADFGAASAIGLLQARANGMPVVAIFAEVQRSPFALMSLKKNGIQNPTDLLGKRVAISDDIGTKLIYNALLQSQNIDPSEIETVDRTTFGVEPLVNEEVDVLGGWIINEGVLLQELGVETNSIILSDYGIDSYDSIIFTTDEMIEKQPEVVESFIRAYLQGLEDVIDNPEKAVEQVLSYDESLDSGEQDRRLQAWLPLIHPGGKQVGLMEPEIWQFIYDIWVEQSPDKSFAVEDVYDNTFIETIYNP